MCLSCHIEKNSVKVRNQAQITECMDSSFFDLLLNCWRVVSFMPYYVAQLSGAGTLGTQRRHFPPTPWVWTWPLLMSVGSNPVVDPTKFGQSEDVRNRRILYVSSYFAINRPNANGVADKIPVTMPRMSVLAWPPGSLMQRFRWNGRRRSHANLVDRTSL